MRNPRDLFQKRRDVEADIRPARYVQPRGLSLHVVELTGPGRQVIVGSYAGGITFSPGDQIDVGSHSGKRNPNILGYPPAGARGGGKVPIAEYTAPDTSRPQILAAHADTIPAGSVNYRILIVGRSFNAAPVDVFQASKWDETTGEEVPDPLATIHDPEYIPDPGTEGLELEDGEGLVAVLVDLAESVAAGYKISVRARRA